MKTSIFITFISLSISGFLLGIFLYLIKPITSKYFSKAWQYYIWILLILRLLVPFHTEVNILDSMQLFIPESTKASQTITLENDSFIPSSEFDIPLQTEYSPSVKMDTPTDNSNITSKFKPVQEKTSKKLSFSIFYLWILWIGGSILMLVIRIVDYRGFLNYIQSNNQPLINELTFMDDLLMDLKIHKNIPIYTNKLAVSPMLIGFFHPFIVLPEEVTNQTQLRYILIHELMHYKRKDIWYKWLFQIVWCIHWFNPILIAVNKTLNLSCELSCDESVLSYLDKQEHKAYGNTLLDLAELSITYRSNVLSTTLIEHKKNLKERLKNIMNYKKYSKLIFLCSAICIGGILFFSAFIGAKPINPEPINLERSSSSTTDKDSTFSESLLNKQMERLLGNTITSSIINNVNTFVNTITSSVVSDIVNNSTDSFYNDFNHSDYNTTMDKIYDNDKAIAGKDLGSTGIALNFQKSKNSISSKKWHYNGTYSLLILNTSADSSISYHYKNYLKSGKLKLVLISPDKTVTTLFEQNSQTSQVDERKDVIPLKKGRNCIKVVAQSAKTENLSIVFGTAEHVTLLFTSEDDEITADCLAKLKAKKATIKDILNCIDYMDDDTIDKVIDLVLQQNLSMTTGEFSHLISYSDDSDLLFQSLLNYLKTGNLTAEQLLISLDYIDSDESAHLLLQYLNQNGSLDESLLNKFFDYIDSDDLLTIFAKLSDQKIKLSNETFLQLIYHLDSDDILDLITYAASHKNPSTLSWFMTAVNSFTMDEDDIYDCYYYLVKFGYTFSKKQIEQFFSSYNICDPEFVTDIINSAKIHNFLTNEEAKKLFKKYVNEYPYDW